MPSAAWRLGDSPTMCKITVGWIRDHAPYFTMERFGVPRREST